MSVIGLGINLIIALGLFAAIIYLQIYLSKQENKWLGLILPIISFLNSLFIILGIASYDAKEHITLIFSSFILTNIPTAIFLLIYYSFRKKIKQKKNFDKMKIQDL